MSFHIIKKVYLLKNFKSYNTKSAKNEKNRISRYQIYSFEYIDNYFKTTISLLSCDGTTRFENHGQKKFSLF